MPPRKDSTPWPWWTQLLLVVVPTAAVSSLLTAQLLLALQAATPTDSPSSTAPTSLLSPQNLQSVLSSFSRKLVKPDPTVLLDQDKRQLSTGASRFLIDPYVTKGPLKWNQLGATVQSDMLLGGKVAFRNYFVAEKAETSSPVWSAENIQNLMNRVKARDPLQNRGLSAYGPATNKAFFEGLDAYPVKGKTVLVIGSRVPWVEAFCLANEAKRVTTVDFNPPKADFPGLSVLSLSELDATEERFDAVFTYSSLEHDGLGRYGDPIHPFGDIERMKKIKGLVADGGLLYLGVPNGPDALMFNAHRVYGPVRFPMLIQGWKLLATFGMGLEETYKLPVGVLVQPLHVLSLEK